MFTKQTFQPRKISAEILSANGDTSTGICCKLNSSDTVPDSKKKKFKKCKKSKWEMNKKK